MNYCSPNNKNNTKSCFNNNELLEIAKAYNLYLKTNNSLCHKRKFIKMKKIDLNNNLYSQLFNRLQPLCKTEHCWIELDIINLITDKELKNKILNNTFKPKASLNSWLSNSHINSFFQQYEFKNFLFLGSQPSDYTKIINIDWDIIKKTKYIGIIFNTDPHYKSGKHWVCVFIDNEKKNVDYFDSLGKLPNKNISSFLKHFSLYNFNINKTIFQKRGNDCGIYTIYYIIQRLNNKTSSEIYSQLNLKSSDKKMKKLRKHIFITN